MPRGIYKHKSRIAWNKGLTKENDERIKQYGIKGSQALKGRKAWNKGKFGILKQSPETIKKRLETFEKIGYLPKPPNWKGKKRSPESVEKSASKRRGIKRPQRSGKNNNLWKGGITPINAKIRTSLEYKIWRRAVFERDNYTCIWCGTRSQKRIKVVLHADHIKPFALFPELRFAIDNGRTLCVDCHKKTDSYLKSTFNGLA